MRAEKKLGYFLTFFYTISILLLIFIHFNKEMFERTEKKSSFEKVKKIIIPKKILNEFGLTVDSLNAKEELVKRNETLSAILSRYNVPNETLSILAGLSKNIFDIRRIVSGRPYHIFTTADISNNLRYFVYEQDNINFIVIDIEDSVKVYAGQKEVTIKRRGITGTINYSLYSSLTENNINPELVVKLAEVYAWQIDFHRIQKGDNFKVIFEEEFVSNEPIGVGRIIGAQFNYNNEDFYAINFTQDSLTQFYDENGKSLRKAFLKAPLEFSRISSRYSKRRFHPVQKRYKPHLGTDYAAPSGTPIRTVGDGVVIEASYSRGNGRYVKIEHNNSYTTQYLHMSKIGSGIRSGVRVKQGEVIGYVGSTGLATGPHLCYRFWKNGVQVDPFNEKIPPLHPVKEEYLKAFTEMKQRIIDELKKLNIPEDEKNSAA